MTTPGVPKLNWARVVGGGLLWALVYSIVAGTAMILFFAREFMRELEQLGRPVDLSPDSLVFLAIFGVLFTIAWGIVGVWLYAAIRPRYGPGPGTAVIAAIGVWLLSVAAPASHLGVFDIASPRFVAIDLLMELVAIVAATLVGARAYRE